MMKIYENERVSRVLISISQIGVPANCGQRTAAKVDIASCCVLTCIVRGCNTASTSPSTRHCRQSSLGSVARTRALNVRLALIPCRCSWSHC